jgi:glutathione S-transferase
MAIVFGASPSPFVRKVRVALAEKNIPYELRPVLPQDKDPEFRKMSPLGKIPAFKDGERALCDSSVICAYLERVHPTPALFPNDPYEYARALWFEEYADTAMSGVIGPKIFFARIVGPRFMNQPADEAAIQKAIDEDLPPLFDYVESQLDERSTLAGGAFSIADVSVVSQLVNLSYAGVPVDRARWPKLAGLFAATTARPSFVARLEEERAFFGS